MTIWRVRVRVRVMWVTIWYLNMNYLSYSTESTVWGINPRRGSLAGGTMVHIHGQSKMPFLLKSV